MGKDYEISFEDLNSITIEGEKISRRYEIIIKNGIPRVYVTDIKGGCRTKEELPEVYVSKVGTKKGRATKTLIDRLPIK